VLHALNMPGQISHLSLKVKDLPLQAPCCFGVVPWFGGDASCGRLSVPLIDKTLDIGKISAQALQFLHDAFALRHDRRCRRRQY
jgi:hypothetical protein